MSKYTFLLLLLCFMMQGLCAEPVNSLDIKKIKIDLKKVEKIIDTRKTDQSNIKKELSETEKEVKKLQSEIEKIQKEKQRTRLEVTKLNDERFSLEKQLKKTKEKIQKILRYQHQNPQPEAVVLVLQNANPNDKLRKIEYIKSIQRQNKIYFNQIKDDHEKITIISANIQNKLNQLEQLEKKNKLILSQLKKKRQNKLIQSNQLEKDIGLQTSRLKRLKKEEKEMNRLINILAQKQKKQQMPVKSVQSRSSQKSNTIIKNTSTLTEEDLKLNAQDHSQLLSSSKENNSIFAKKQRKLARPIQGNIIHYFGSEKEEGAIWKGVVIQAAYGSPVKSIADGEVIYIGSVSGYGSIIVVNHDGYYMSIYSGLSKVLSSVGSKVQAGTFIASSGALSNGENGLYFELRKQTQPINPLGWFN